MRVRIVMYKQDDPRKCTAARLVREGKASKVADAAPATLLLNPFAEQILLAGDKKHARSITAIDCSWRLSGGVFEGIAPRLQKKLPPLFAGNPVNYAKLGKLSTAEALAGALYIMGFVDLAGSMLEGQKWGHTFFDLNASLLDDYSKLDSQEAMPALLKEYGITGYNLI